MKSVLRLILLLLTAAPFISRQVSAQIYDPDRAAPYQRVFVETDEFGIHYLDTLEKYWDQPEEEIRFAMLNDLAYYWHTRNLLTSMQWTKKGLEITKDNPLWLGRFQITQGSILLRMERLDSAQIVLEDARSKVSHSDLPFLNTQLGYVFERRGELDKAADYALESLHLGESLQDSKAIALAYSDLSNIFWKQGKFEKGLEYGLRSLEYFDKWGINDMDHDFTLYVVGNNYLELGDQKKALEYFQKSIDIGEQYGFYNNLSDVYISLVDLNLNLGNHQEAALAGDRALIYAKLLQNNFMIMRSWLSIGKVQNEQKEYDQAIASLSTCVQVATSEFGDEYFLHQAYLELATAYEGKGDFKNAYAALQQYDQLKAQVFTAEADERVAKLQTEYDVALKESTIKLQETELSQQKTRFLIILLIAIFLFLFLGVLYRTYQLNKKKNALLEKQNKEKEFLLKEIHHRVKNNLETVSSLLALQSAQLSDDNAVDAMQESQSRVQSMSMIHQKLYQGTNLSTIEMKDYFNNLGDYVLDSFSKEEEVEIHYHMNELELDVDTAIPLGLIVNELLSNAMKYAFEGRDVGRIDMLLHKTSSNELHLEVKDNGVGYKSNGESKGTGFGMQLVDLLCRQLQGQMKLEQHHGTSFIFDFKLN